MKMTRSQRLIIIVLFMLTAIICGVLATIFSLNSQEILRAFGPTPTETAIPPTLVPTETPTLVPTDTPPPTPTAVPTFTPSPTPNAPQTDYDTQIANEPENPSLRLQRAYAYIEMGVYTDAIGDLNLAISASTGMSETLAEAHTGLGQARFHLKKWGAALGNLNQAVILNPDLADAHAWRGRLLAEWGEYELGIEALRQAVTLDETDPIKYIWLGQALLRGQRPDEAKEAYSASLLLHHSVEAYVGQAMAEAARGDLVAVEANMSHAMSTGPFHPAALNARAWFFSQYEQERLFEAAQLAQQAVDGAKDDLEKARYLYTLGQIYEQQGHRDRAIAALEEAIILATIEGNIIYDEITEYLAGIKITE
ncbi:MAG: tetratricopeptide repeat protein [Chloroflexi bacterium]|nr:tetratricopeptide repeat protein [Chloroflexota bacterium]